MKTLKDMANIIQEIKEYEELKRSLALEVEKLKKECIEWMEEQGIDEVVTDAGKVTYREVLSKRFNSTDFKKDYLALFEQYVTLTSNMRFTCN